MIAWAKVQLIKKSLILMRNMFAVHEFFLMDSVGVGFRAWRAQRYDLRVLGRADRRERRR